MTLQSRLADLAAAVGADIKSHGTRLTAVEAANRYDTAPIGSVLSWTRKTFPEGYVLGDGARYSNAQYPQGYAAAQAESDAGNPLWTYRISDQTFTVPDLTNRFLYGQGAKAFGTRSQPDPTQANPGEETHLLLAAESGLKDHTHTTRFTRYFDIQTVAPAPRAALDVHDGAAGGGAVAQDIATSGSGSANAAQVHNNMPPYVVLAHIVKIAGVTASASVIQGPPGPAGASIQGPPGPAGASTPHDDIQIFSGNIAANGALDVAFDYGSTSLVAFLTRIRSNRAARIRVYTDTTHRDADRSRAATTDPVGDHGCLLEVVTTSGVLDLRLSPGVIARASTNTTLPIIVDNRDGVNALTGVWMTYFGLT